MDLQLEGRRALVTGASSGIGAAVARRLVAEGVDVLLTGRDARRLEAARAAADAAGQGVVADLIDAASVAALVAASSAEQQRVDILVTCAGSYPLGGMLETAPERFAAMHTVNVLPFVALCQALVPAMTSAGWGRVITVGDIAVQHAVAGAAAYTASKAALVHLALTLSQELAGSGVTSNVVSPGLALLASPLSDYTDGAHLRIDGAATGLAL